MTKLKVVYIAGSGRTGSTLLSLLLSQSAGIQNVGQIRDIHRGVTNNPLCSCGSRFRECAFWSPVLADVAAHAASRGLDAASPEFARRLRQVADATDWTNLASGGALPGDLTAAVERLYHACAESSGSSCLIDSSKSPELALALSRAPTIDLYLLNLVRDPRAVACSWEKKYGADRERIVTQCRAWKSRQRQLAQLGRCAPNRFKLLRYEDLTAAPRSAVEQCLRWAGLPPETENFRDGRTAMLSWERQHLFPPANEGMLAQKPEETRIETRDDWRKSGRLVTRFLAGRCAFPMQLRFGYGLF